MRPVDNGHLGLTGAYGSCPEGPCTEAVQLVTHFCAGLLRRVLLFRRLGRWVDVGQHS